MIPILLHTSSNYDHIGYLIDCSRCIVTEERNGIYECEFDYPVTGSHFDDIAIGGSIGCTHNEQGDIQIFDIYAKSEPINGVVTFQAHHMSYRLNEITVKPFTAGSCSEALGKIKSQSVDTNPFTFWTDKTVTSEYTSKFPRKARNMLGGEENSILDVFGTGEYEFDNYSVKLHLHRGQETDVSIRYGKNLRDFTNKEDSEDLYTAVVPFWLGTDAVGNEVLVTLPEWIVDSGKDSPSGRDVIVPMDLSSDFGEQPTEAWLRTRAQNKLSSSQAWKLKQNVTVDFVQLWQTEEYRDFSPLQRVNLCDTVEIVVPMYDISVKAKVIKTVYNVLLDRYDKMELGDKSPNLSTVIDKAYDGKIAETTREIQTDYTQAIDHATEMICGGMGGYVLTTLNANGQPVEILITDNLDPTQAVNIWRWNQGGLGHSHTGYDGPYSDIALTADGQINAALIKVGTLTDENGNTSFDLTTGLLTMTKGSINLGNGKFIATDAGKITAIDGTIGRFTVDSVGFSYESNVRKATIDDEGVTYRSNTTNGKRYGISITGAYIEFLTRDDQTAWDLTRRATIYPSYSSESARNDLYIGVGDAGSNTIAARFTDAGDYAAVFPNGAYVTGKLYVYDESYLRSKVGMGMGLEVANGLNVNSGAFKVSNYGNGAQITVTGTFSVTGSKNRIVPTENYAIRGLSCYETPTPLFGDIGEAVIDSDGICYVDIDDIFSETIADKTEYQVFLQKEGEGDCWVAEKNPRYFAIQGTPGLKVAWEMKAKQLGYENIRLELYDNNLDEYIEIENEYLSLDDYIKEQEGLLYG